MNILNEKLKDYKVILSSKSPRRHHLLKELGVDFEIQALDVEEVYPDGLNTNEVAEYLAILKAKPFKENWQHDKDLVITCDTIVSSENKVIGKPKDRNDAVKTLQHLSNKWHEVISGVCITLADRQIAFSETTKVLFNKLQEEEIKHYIEHYQPFDKAGSYGIQEWIGYVGIKKIDGDFFNVMGFPVHRLYQTLLQI